jgi:hypothetical protein
MDKDFGPGESLEFDSRQIVSGKTAFSQRSVVRY